MTRETYLQGIPRLSKRISCFLAVRHTIPAVGNEKFSLPIRKLQNFWSVRPILVATTLLPARGAQARYNYKDCTAFQTFFMLPRGYAHNPSNRGPKSSNNYNKTSKYSGAGAYFVGRNPAPSRGSQPRSACKGSHAFPNVFHAS